MSVAIHNLYNTFANSAESLETFVYLLVEEYKYDDAKALIRLACQRFQASAIIPRSVKLIVYRDDIAFLEWFVRTYPRTTYKITSRMRPWGTKCASYFLRCGYLPSFYDMAQMIERNEMALFHIVAELRKEHLLDLVEVAIQYNRIEALQLIERYHPTEAIKKIAHNLEIAVARASMKVLRAYFPRCRKMGLNLMRRALILDKVRPFEYLYSEGVRFVGPELFRYRDNRVCHRYLDYIRYDEPEGYQEMMRKFPSLKPN